MPNEFDAAAELACDDESQAKVEKLPVPIEDEFAEIVCTTDLSERPVKIDGGDYVIRELLGKAKGKWMTKMGPRMKMDHRGQPVGVKNFEGLQASLICLCMFEKVSGTAVTEEIIENWPAKVQDKLFLACQKINGMTTQSAEAAKNG